MLRITYLCLLIFLCAATPYAQTNEELRKHSQKKVIQATKIEVKYNGLMKTMIAEKMAVRSIKLTDRVEQALVAQQAYRFLKEVSRKDERISGTQNAAIYNALYYAIKRFSNPHYNQFKGHSFTIRAIIPTYGNYIYSTGSDGTICKSDLEGNLTKGAEIVPLVNTNEVNRTLSLSPSAKILASGGNSGIVRLYNIDNRGNLAPRSKINTKQTEVLKVVMAGNNEVFALGANGDVTYWRQKDKKWQRQVVAQDKAKMMVAINQKIAWNKGKNILVYRNRVVGKTFELLVSNKDRITTLEFSKDGNWLAAGTQNGFLYLWNTSGVQPVPTNTQTTLPRHLAQLNNIAFNYVGTGETTLMATSSWDKTIRIYEMNNLAKEPIVLKDYKGWVRSVCFSGDGTKLLAGCKDNLIRVWSAIVDDMKDLIEETGRVRRNLSIKEWNRHVGKKINYERTFPKLPDGAGVKPEDKHRED